MKNVTHLENYLKAVEQTDIKVTIEEFSRKFGQISAQNAWLCSLQRKSKSCNMMLGEAQS